MAISPSHTSLSSRVLTEGLEQQYGTMTDLGRLQYGFSVSSMIVNLKEERFPEFMVIFAKYSR